MEHALRALRSVEHNISPGRPLVVPVDPYGVHHAGKVLENMLGPRVVVWFPHFIQIRAIDSVYRRMFANRNLYSVMCGWPSSRRVEQDPAEKVGVLAELIESGVVQCRSLSVTVESADQTNLLLRALMKNPLICEFTLVESSLPTDMVTLVNGETMRLVEELISKHESLRLLVIRGRNPVELPMNLFPETRPGPSFLYASLPNAEYVCWESIRAKKKKVEGSLMFACARAILEYSRMLPETEVLDSILPGHVIEYLCEVGYYLTRLRMDPLQFPQ